MLWNIFASIIINNFTSGLKLDNSIERALIIYCDNFAAVFFYENNKSGSQNKHISIKFLVSTNHIKKNKIIIKFINIIFILIDPMTKDLSAKLYKDHFNNMGVIGSKWVCFI